MSENKQVHGTGKPGSEATNATDAADRPASWSRRRFGVAAVSTSVIVGLHSQPLRAAGGGGNCTPSGWVSGNVSLHGEAQSCGGMTPEAWAGGDPPAERERWADAHFNSVFKGTPPYSVEESGDPATMLDAVSQDVRLGSVGDMERQVIRLGAAAYLNAEYLVYPMTPQTVIEMVRPTLVDGQYITQSGDVLNAEQVKDFLGNTMEAPGFFA